MIVSFLMMADIFRFVEPRRNTPEYPCVSCETPIHPGNAAIMQMCRDHGQVWFMHETCFRSEAQKFYLASCAQQKDIARHVRN